MVAGDFGKFHEGHKDHISKASKLADFIIIVTHTDESIRTRKHYTPDPLEKRIDALLGFLNEIKKCGCVVMSVDSDGTVAKTLEHYQPDIFAKGGDRTPDNMPQSELDICENLGIRIVYGMGDKLNESRKLCT